MVAAGRGTVRTAPGRMVSGSWPMACRLAAYSAGQPPGTPSAAAMPDKVSPAATVYRAGAVWLGSTRTVPGRMVSGSWPMACRLAAYSAGQPPGTPSAAATPDRVSPGRTTYLAAGLDAATAGAAIGNVLVRVTSILLAMRVFAGAGWTGPLVPTAASGIDKMLPASTTHADVVHARIVLSLSFRGVGAGLLGRAPKGNRSGKERT